MSHTANSTSAAVTPLIFNGESLVRIVQRDAETWWVLKDVCNVLQIKNDRHASKRLRDSEKGVAFSDTLGGCQEMIIINEPGLYRLIMRSNLPSAQRFQDWVFHEVLPQIRKTGSYGKPAELTDAEKLEKARLAYALYGRRGGRKVFREFGWQPDEDAPSVSRLTYAEELTDLILGTIRAHDGLATFADFIRSIGRKATRAQINERLRMMMAAGAIGHAPDGYRILM